MQYGEQLRHLPAADRDRGRMVPGNLRLARQIPRRRGRCLAGYIVRAARQTRVCAPASAPGDLRERVGASGIPSKRSEHRVRPARTESSRKPEVMISLLDARLRPPAATPTLHHTQSKRARVSPPGPFLVEPERRLKKGLRPPSPSSSSVTAWAGFTSLNDHEIVVKTHHDAKEITHAR